jgi:membrane protein DedA with SNARE-associated domain
MANLNYFTVALLMAIESTFLPLPSEVVIPFAAYKAAQGQLNVFGVVLFGTAGALCGSLINKFADSGIGRVFLLSREKVEHAENYFIRNGKSSTFIGRLVPGIRHLISIPAGLARMSLRDFMLFTFTGAAIWNIILAIIGFYLYEVRDKIFPYLGYILLTFGVGFVIYLIMKARIKSSDKNNSH